MRANQWRVVWEGDQKCPADRGVGRRYPDCGKSQQIGGVGIVMTALQRVFPKKKKSLSPNSIRYIRS